MQINRLFETVYMLLNQPNVTAKDLADRFEVSTRTIYRDIEVLSSAGIPVYMTKGKGGGIRLIDNFVLNKTVLSQNEQDEILNALQSLSATNYPQVNHVLSKLSSYFNREFENWISVDFSNWSYSNREKFLIIKEAVLSKRVAVFDYYSRDGVKTQRYAEPLQLWFKQNSWYVIAICRTRHNYRTFKLSRIKNLRLTDEFFDRNTSIKTISDDTEKSDVKLVKLVLKIDASQAYRVYDEFDEDMVSIGDDGSFTVTVEFPEDEWVYGYILSFGHYAVVEEPLYLKNIIHERLKLALATYS